jgi:predicted nucleic acid-binding protein
VIFVDTGAWFAVAVRSDPDHAAAMAWLERNREPVLTTDYMLAETATLWRRGLGNRLASRAGRRTLFDFRGEDGVRIKRAA